jgi:hypothetical protein
VGDNARSRGFEPVLGESRCGELIARDSIFTGAVVV